MRILACLFRLRDLNITVSESGLERSDPILFGLGIGLWDRSFREKPRIISQK